MTVEHRVLSGLCRGLQPFADSLLSEGVVGFFKLWFKDILMALASELYTYEFKDTV